MYVCICIYLTMICIHIRKPYVYLKKSSLQRMVCKACSNKLQRFVVSKRCGPKWAQKFGLFQQAKHGCFYKGPVERMGDWSYHPGRFCQANLQISQTWEHPELPAFF